MTSGNSTAARTLAEHLGEASDEELEKLFESRRLAANANPAASWQDFFDAAEALLRPESIAIGLAALPREDLAQLSAGAPHRVVGLTGSDDRALPAVAAHLDGRIVSPAPHTQPTPADPDAAGHAAERAFTTLSSLADLLLQALRIPLSRVGTGAVGAADRRRLADQNIARSPEHADALVDLALATGLMHGRDRRIGTSADGSAWVRRSTPERWSQLVERLREALPAGLRTATGGWIDPAHWEGAYPLDERWPERARRWSGFARMLALITDDDPPTEPAWATSAREGGEVDPSGLTALLPHEVDAVYLQNDLTAISPGPLAPALDARLRDMASRESHAQASTYRFTEASLSRALTMGETAESIHAFLAELSLTGVPQPLDYLIERAAARHGLVRVSRDVTTGHTVVSSRDHDLIRTLSVDQSLGALRLVADGALLTTRSPRDVTFWALADARYPAVVIDDEGGIVALDRHRVAPDPDPPASFGALIARLREAHGDDADAAWRERELVAAIREKAVLVVTVDMPDGSSRELTLEPTGIGGGRLRGRDARADVERTLPVSLISRVERA